MSYDRHIPSLKMIDRMLGDGLRHDYSDPEQKMRELRTVLVGWKEGSIPSRALLSEANTILQGHGVEYLESEDSQAKAYYVNMGDTYTPTIILDTQRDKVWATDWGSWLEAEERAGHTFR